MKIKDFKKHYKDCLPVGEGWRPLLTKLVEDIIKIAPETEITQIKEKFGTLRFYCAGDGGDEIYKLIERAEQESAKTCEHCGTKDSVTTEGGWLLTLCNKCRKERNS
jgi:hypothetical protein